MTKHSVLKTLNTRNFAVKNVKRALSEDLSPYCFLAPDISLNRKNFGKRVTPNGPHMRRKSNSVTVVMLTFLDFSIRKT